RPWPPASPPSPPSPRSRRRRHKSRRRRKSPKGTDGSAVLLGRRRPQPLRIDVDDEGRQQDQAADQDLQETVDVDVIEAVVEDAEHEQADDGIADAAAAAEQAGA